MRRCVLECFVAEFKRNDKKLENWDESCYLIPEGETKLI